MEKHIINRYTLIGLFLLFTTNLWAAPPARVYTYTTGEIIAPDKVTNNEDVIFSYLTTGVDTYVDGSIINADISGSAAITYGKLSLGSSILTGDIKDGEIVNGDISSSAAIGYSKLSIAAGDIAYSKLSLGSSILSTDIKNDEIVNADINSSAAIVDTKLYTISTAGKVLGAALNTLSGVPSGAGQIPVANLGTGTGSSANYLRGDGAWTTLSQPTQVNDTDAGTSFGSTTTFLTVNKTITSGNTVMLTASGYFTASSNPGDNYTITLKQGSTTVQAIVLIGETGNKNYSWSTCGMVTGLSGSIAFSVTAVNSTEAGRTGTIYGNLNVLEF